MFLWRKAPRQDTAPSRDAARAVPSARTVLRSGWDFKGRVYGKGEIVLQSAFEGELDLQGRVILERTGTAKGTLRADDIQIGGRVEGVLESTRRVVLESAARMEGDVATPRREMAEGAHLNGRVDMRRQHGQPAD